MRTLPFLMICALAGTASGQSADEIYHHLIVLVKGGDLGIDFRALRFACLDVKGCDARGDSKLQASAQQALRDKKYKDAGKTAQALIDKGYPNITAHVIAASAYQALGEEQTAKFHHDVAEGLIRSILKSGDGKSKETAFEVIGTFEEYTMISVLSLGRVTGQSLLSGKLSQLRRPQSAKLARRHHGGLFQYRCFFSDEGPAIDSTARANHVDGA